MMSPRAGESKIAQRFIGGIEVGRFDGESAERTTDLRRDSQISAVRFTDCGLNGFQIPTNRWDILTLSAARTILICFQNKSSNMGGC
jgi:hypothetical protein